MVNIMPVCWGPSFSPKEYSDWCNVKVSIISIINTGLIAQVTSNGKATNCTWRRHIIVMFRRE